MIKGLKIREDLRGTDDLREAVEEAFSDVRNTDRPVMRKFKDDLMLLVINNDWAELKKFYFRTGDTSLKLRLEAFISNENQVWEAAWRELDWETYQEAIDFSYYLNLHELEEETTYTTLLSNALYLFNSMVETLQSSTTNNYSAGCMFADALNDKIASAEFWMEQIRKELNLNDQ